MSALSCRHYLSYVYLFSRRCTTTKYFAWHIQMRDLKPVKHSSWVAWPWRWRQCVPSKRRYPFTNRRKAQHPTSLKSSATAVRPSNLEQYKSYNLLGQRHQLLLLAFLKPLWPMRVFCVEQCHEDHRKCPQSSFQPTQTHKGHVIQKVLARRPISPR